MKPDLKDVRVYTQAEIRQRADERKSQKQRKTNRDPGEIVRRPNRVRTKFRYCVSLNPKTAAFLRLQYGGDDNSLSNGIERVAAIVFQLSKEALTNDPMLGLVRMTKKQQKTIEDSVS